jgi:hypothetical protein
VVVGPDLTFNGETDGFIAKVRPDGTDFEYCGYIGGDRKDWAWAVAVDPFGHAYVGGRAASTEATFPVTVGPDLTHNGEGDVFVAKVSLLGDSLEYCGYVGGAGEEGIQDIAVDRDGSAYVAGHTGSDEESFPVVVGPDLTFNGKTDGFVARVRESGEGLDYCGYIGGDEVDEISGIAIDERGQAYVAGDTESHPPTFPVRDGPYTTRHVDVHDMFVAKIRAQGDELISSGFFGGARLDHAGGIAISRTGEIFLVGHTKSVQGSFPVEGGPDLTFNGGDADAFVARLRAPIGCLAGSVNLGAAGTPSDVLSVNGVSERWVEIPIGEPIEVRMEASPSGPSPGPFVLYAWPGEPDSLTMTVQPHGLGMSCFATYLSGGIPKPRWVWNNIGHPYYLGEPDFPSEPAPSVVVDDSSGAPRPGVVTLQGILVDDGAVGEGRASVTNAVIVQVVP